MRLLHFRADGEISMAEFFGNNIPPYAILSHTWGPDYDEVTYGDLLDGTGKSKVGYSKIRFCGYQAAKDGLQYFWVDTCCIDKSSSTELTEAINSMFRCYQEAGRCYVYLSDVSVSSLDRDDEFPQRWKSTFRHSRWFTRCWSLQELIAPASVEFFSVEGQRLGDKQSLEQTLYEITGIAIQALQGRPLGHFSVIERMSWAEKRYSKREEDAAYSLLGLFGVYMSMNYAEGIRNAFLRLWDEILRKNEDYTVLLWKWPSHMDKFSQTANWNPLAFHHSLAIERRKDTSKKLEWSKLKLHSPLDLVSATTITGHLPPINNIPQAPHLTVRGLRMSLFSKVVGSDLISWTYYTQEWNGRTYAVCVRVIPKSPGKLAEMQHLRGALGGEVYHVEVSRLKGFEPKDIYFVLR